MGLPSIGSVRRPGRLRLANLAEDSRRHRLLLARAASTSLKRRRISVCRFIRPELQSRELALTHGNSYRFRC